jgi:transglutaminase-like putative cysteine protease
LVAVAVVVAWVSSLGWLVQREYFPRAGAEVRDLPASFPPSAAFYAMWSRERQIGIVSTTADTVDDGIRIAARQDLDLPLGEGTRRAIFSSNGLYTQDLHLRTFSSRLSGEAGGYFLEGSVEGDSLLILSLTVPPATEPDRYQLAISGAILLPEAVPLAVALSAPMTIGREEEVHVFDPVRLSLYRQQLTVAAESILVVPDSADLDSVSGLWVPAQLDTLNAWRLDTWDRGLPVRLWVDRAGYLIASRSPLGVRVERSAFEIVRGNYRGRERPTPLSAARAPLATPPGRDALTQPAPSELSFRLTGAEWEDSDWGRLGLEEAGQTRRNDTLIVRASGLEGGGLPYRLPFTNRMVWDSMASYVLAGADPRVEAQARRIIRRIRDPRAGVEALTDWVARNLRLEPGGVPQSAVSTLERRRGSTSDIVLAFVALARASGIPARPVAGFLHAADQFHYHAWSEVYLGRWVAVDPVYGQFPADARHIRAAVDGLSRPLELVPLLARVRPRATAGSDQP